MTNVASLYRDGRARIAALVRDLNDERLGLKVPACPEWTVEDVVSHLSGVCVDIINGNIDGVATEPWTAAHVDARRTWPIGKILQEWDEFAQRCEEICHLFPGGTEVQWLADLTTHEHDIRGALGDPGERDSEAVRVAFEWLVERFGTVLAHRGLPPLLVKTDEDELVAGGADPPVSVRGSRFDLFRALTGRRSLEQITELGWEGDRKEHVRCFEQGWGPFRPAAGRIVE